LELLSDLKKYYLVIYLLSGGGSALCEKPVTEEISLEDSRAFFRLLVTCGANIVEMNVLRKHFSAVKGGRLAQTASPARQMTLYISDVPVDKPSTVASGPTMPDESSVEDCYEIVERLGLLDKLPAPMRSIFHDRRIPETPKPGDEIFRNSSWHCLLDNQAGLDLLRAEADRQGWVVDQDLSVDDTPLEQAADRLLARLENLRTQNPGRTVALLTGGELSWPVTGDGRGGRNQAFVLDCARKIAGRNIAVVSAGTDGIDGNSEAAGAVADGTTLDRAAKLGLDAADFQNRSDSYRFFEALDDLIVTGPSGNNVRDLRLLVAWD
jgi:hydroxypyruvate reductase